MDTKNLALSLQEISTQSVKDLPLSSRVVVFPIGSNEQHGPHLPTGTDTLILEAVVHGARQRLSPQDPFLFMPILPYGKSPEHMDFAGTISFRATTILAILEDIVISLHKHGMKKVVFLNGHGGNTSLLNAVAHDFRYSHQVFVSCLSLWSEDFLSTSEIEMIIPPMAYPEVHAASVETSLLLHLRPELVGAVPQEFKPKAAYPSIPSGWATTDLSTNGVIGDPRHSSAERGQLLYELLVNKTVAKLKQVAERN